MDLPQDHSRERTFAITSPAQVISHQAKLHRGLRCGSLFPMFFEHSRASWEYSRSAFKPATKAWSLPGSAVCTKVTQRTSTG